VLSSAEQRTRGLNKIILVGIATCSAESQITGAGEAIWSIRQAKNRSVTSAQVLSIESAMD
jgi:hypothetical protein